MLSVLITTGIIASGFGWYHVADWIRHSNQIQAEQQADCPKSEPTTPGCGRRDG